MKPSLRVLDITAMMITLFATLIQIIGCYIPNWWTYESYSGEKLVVGIVRSSGCDLFGRCDNTIVDIDGGKEWLFMTRIFEQFGVILCLIATVVHIHFLPKRDYNVRSVAIYTLGAAGIFILMGAFIFASMFNDLGTIVAGEKGTESVGPGFGLCILSGLLCVAAALVTGFATVKKADDYYNVDVY